MPTASKTEETRLIEGKEMTFKQYMEEVNLHIAGNMGFDSEDLADFNFVDAWDAGTPPRQTARDTVSNDMGGMFGDDEELLDLFFGDM